MAGSNQRVFPMIDMNRRDAMGRGFTVPQPGDTEKMVSYNALANGEMLYNETVDEMIKQKIYHMGNNEKVIYCPSGMIQLFEGHVRGGLPKSQFQFRGYNTAPNPTAFYDLYLPDHIENLSPERISTAEKVLFNVTMEETHHIFLGVFFKENGKLFICDSLPKLPAIQPSYYQTSVQAMKMIIAALGYQFKSLHIPKCTAQNDSVSCGLFAIRFAIAAMTGESITLQGFNVNEYRKEVAAFLLPHYQQLSAEARVGRETSTATAYAKWIENIERRERLWREAFDEPDSDAANDPIANDPIVPGFTDDIMNEALNVGDSNVSRLEIHYPDDPVNSMQRHHFNNFAANNDYNDYCNNQSQMRGCCEISRSAMTSLVPGRWLHEDVINAMFYVYTDRGYHRDFTDILQMDPAMVQQCDRLADIADKEPLLSLPSNLFVSTEYLKYTRDVYKYKWVALPICYADHWTLCIYEPGEFGKDDHAFYYDSLHPTEKPCGHIIKRIRAVWNDVRDEYEIKEHGDLIVDFPNLPIEKRLVQNDALNCGVFVIMNLLSHIFKKDLTGRDPDEFRMYLKECLMHSVYISVRDVGEPVMGYEQMKEMWDEEVDNPNTVLMIKREIEEYDEDDYSINDEYDFPGNVQYDADNASNATSSTFALPIMPQLIKGGAPAVSDSMIEVGTQFSKAALTTPQSKKKKGARIIDDPPPRKRLNTGGASSVTASSVIAQSPSISVTDNSKSRGSSKRSGTRVNVQHDADGLAITNAIIDNFIVKLCDRCLDTVVFPTDAWVTDSVLPISYVGSAHISRYIIPIRVDADNNIHGAVIAKITANGKWKGTLYDLSSKCVRKELRERIKSFMHKYCLPKFTVTVAENNIVGKNPFFSGLYVCSRVYGELQGTFINDPNEIRKKIREILGIQDIPKAVGCPTTIPLSQSDQHAADVKRRYHSQTRLQRDDRMKSNDNLKDANQKKAFYATNKDGPVRSYRKKYHYYMSQPTPPRFSLGSMEPCRFCKAMKFKCETTGSCCKEGTCIIEDRSLQEVAPCLLNYRMQTLANTSAAKAELQNQRQINRAVSFACTTVKCMKSSDFHGGGPVPVIIDGQFQVQTCDLITQKGCTVAFGQLYTCSNEDALIAWEKLKDDYHMKVDSNTFMSILDIIKQNHPFAQAYNTAYELLKEGEVAARALGQTFTPNLMITLKDARDINKDDKPADQHIGTLNKPLASNQCFAIYATDDGAITDKIAENGTFIFAKYQRGRKSTDVPPFSPNYDPLAYALVFPNGEQPFRKGQKKSTKHKTMTRQFMSMNEIALTMFARRGNLDLNRFQNLGTLQNVHYRVIANRYEFVRKKRLAYGYQKAIKKSNGYKLIEAKMKKGGMNMGHYVSLPESTPGSRAYMHKRYHDYMALCHRFKGPHLFITFTGSSEYPEIQNNLVGNNTPEDDPFLGCRTFKGYFDDFRRKITEKSALGKVAAWMVTYEWQKRGMTHSHMLVCLEEEPTLEQIDEMVTARIPDLPTHLPATHPDYIAAAAYRTTVIKRMIHRPCDKDDGTRFACRDGYAGKPKCAKGFPKDFCEETIRGTDNYVRLKRPDDGTLIPTGRIPNLAMVDNRWVVPHNRNILMEYDSHINVEILNSLNTVKYVCKYGTKGPDYIIAMLQKNLDPDVSKKMNMRKDKDGNITVDYDESLITQMFKITGPYEAAWFLLNYPLTEMSHSVKALHVHMPDENLLYYEESDEPDVIAHKEGQAKSKLMHFFDANAKNIRVTATTTARDHTFVQIDELCAIQNGAYEKRKRANKVVSRINPVPPTVPETFAIYVMLLTGKGFTSFDDMKAGLDGQPCGSFMDAARVKGYVRDDRTWLELLERSSREMMPKSFTHLFAVIMIQGHAPLIKEMFDQFVEDMFYQDKEKKYTWAQQRMRVLFRLQSIIRHHGKKLSMYGLEDVDAGEVEAFEAEELANDDDAVKRADASGAQLNSGQLMIKEFVKKAIENPNEENRCFFIQGSGGTGKTTLYDHLIDWCLAKGYKVIASASSAIAAKLLRGGRTLHSVCGIPVNLPYAQSKEPTHDINSDVGKTLKGVDLFIWDEAPMQGAVHLEYVEKLLRNLQEGERRKLPFGGVTMLLGGDWKQTLCVMEGVNGPKILDYTLKQSDLWGWFTQLKLEINMRVKPEEKDFAEWLEKVGTGELNVQECLLRIPNEMVIVNRELFINFVFPKEVLSAPDEMNGRAILAMRNVDCHAINDEILSRIPGQIETIRGFTEHMEEGDDDSPLVSLEDLTNQTPSGMPPNTLKLKIGAPLILLRNLSIASGLCNGTRLILQEYLRDDNGHIQGLKCKNVTAENSDFPVIIPRIRLRYEGVKDGLKFLRTQFPVRLGFSMTVNKSQGQTLRKVGLMLDNGQVSFTHGQFYVAVSRVRSVNDIRVFMPSFANKKADKYGKTMHMTKNIVYKDILG